MKQKFTNLFEYFKARSRTVVGVVLALLVMGGIAYSRSGSDEVQLLTLTPDEFVQEVSVSGTVVATDDVDLSFAESGRVDYIAVKVGDKVTRGQSLASLSIGTLRADLLSAQADLALKRAEAGNTETSLERVREQQDTLVESANSKLLSEGLAAVPRSSDGGPTPPVVTGRYRGKEGVYKIRFSPGAQLSLDRVELRTFDLETTGPIEMLKNEPTQLGTKGLFITLPDDSADYEETTWYVTIPNTKGTVYQANYSAYQEALRTREKEVSAAEAEVNRRETETTVVEAQIARAEAAVARVQAEIAERTLRAPFAGTVTNVDAKLGSVASANTPAVSLISDATLQIESFVPEINIPLLAVGDSAVVTLDAYGSDVPFEAKVVFLDPAETVRDGVSTYRAKLEFVSRDERVRSGMTANVTITTERKSNVLTVPSGIVIDKNGKKIVRVRQGGEVVERVVVLGSVSSVGQVEIVSGLVAGEQVLLTTSE